MNIQSRLSVFVLVLWYSSTGDFCLRTHCCVQICLHRCSTFALMVMTTTKKLLHLVGTRRCGLKHGGHFCTFPSLDCFSSCQEQQQKVEEALLDDAEIQILISCKVMKQQFYSLAFVESVLKAQSDHAILYKLDNHRPVLLTHLLKIFI